MRYMRLMALQKERKEWKMNKKGRTMRIACNLIKARPCAPSVIRKERYLVISNPVSMFKRMEEKEIFYKTENECEL